MTRAFLIYLLLTVLPAAALDAQRVSGRLLDPGGEGVPGALVLLVNPGGERLTGSLTDASGAFALLAPGPGTYRIRAERIGYRSTSSEPFELRSGEVHVETISASEAAVELEGVTVSGAARCALRSDAGPEMLRVWEEARKALTAVELAEEAGNLSFLTTRYRRAVDRRGQVLAEETFAEQVLGSHPFRAPPVDLLLSEGFVRREHGNHVFSGPDASTLLSPAFLDVHCFHLVDGEEGQVGLAFAPLPERRRIPGITGVLWLDRRSAALSHVEFAYTRVPLEGRPSDFGGRVDFDVLEGGTWYVRSWSLRMPHQVVFSSTPGGPERRLLVREVGGRVQAVLRD